MKNNKLDNVILGVLLGAAIIIVAMCIIVTVVPRPRNSKAEKVDLNCITEPKKNPLKECKE